MGSTTDAAKAIRAEYKRRGWSSKMIGVRSHLYSMGSSIYVTIKHPSIPMVEAERIAMEAESVRRCEITGDILNGGNRYVHVNHTDECREILAGRYLEAVRDAVARLPEENSSALETVEGVDGHDVCVGTDHRWGAQLWFDGSASQIFDRSNPQTGAYALALLIA